MLAILNSLNSHNFPIFQPILMLLVSKFMVHRALFDKIYLSLGLLSSLIRTVAYPRHKYYGDFKHYFAAFSTQAYLFLFFSQPLDFISHSHAFSCLMLHCISRIVYNLFQG